MKHKWRTRRKVVAEPTSLNAGIAKIERKYKARQTRLYTCYHSGSHGLTWEGVKIRLEVMNAAEQAEICQARLEQWTQREPERAEAPVFGESLTEVGGGNEVVEGRKDPVLDESVAAVPGGNEDHQAPGDLRAYQEQEAVPHAPPEVEAKGPRIPSPAMVGCKLPEPENVVTKSEQVRHGVPESGTLVPKSGMAPEQARHGEAPALQARRTPQRLPEAKPSGFVAPKPANVFDGRRGVGVKPKLASPVKAQDPNVVKASAMEMGKKLVADFQPLQQCLSALADENRSLEDRLTAFFEAPVGKGTVTPLKDVADNVNYVHNQVLVETKNLSDNWKRQIDEWADVDPQGQRGMFESWDEDAEARRLHERPSRFVLFVGQLRGGLEAINSKLTAALESGIAKSRRKGLREAQALKSLEPPSKNASVFEEDGKNGEGEEDE